MGRGIDVSRQEVWRKRLERFIGWPGTAAEFCRREGVTQASFYVWRKRLSPGGRSGPGRAIAATELEESRVAAERGRRGSARFVELSVTGTAWVEIELPNGAVVRVPAERDTALRVAISAAGEWGTHGRNTPSREVRS